MSAGLFRLLEATWPPAARQRVGPWVIRDGRGGGKRVGAATAEGPWTADDITQAEAAMAALDQPALFMVRPGEEALDAALEARGYGVVDPTILYAIDTAALTDQPLPPVSAFHIWPPLAIMVEIWAAGGIGPARLDVMDRVAGPKTAIFGRRADQPAGAAFVAVHEGTAMIHAIEVLTAHRNRGLARIMLRAAAFWAEKTGATRLALAVTRANAAANGLYSSLGMEVVGQYHYRAR